MNMTTFCFKATKKNKMRLIKKCMGGKNNLIHKKKKLPEIQEKLDKADDILLLRFGSHSDSDQTSQTLR